MVSLSPKSSIAVISSGEGPGGGVGSEGVVACEGVEFSLALSFLGGVAGLPDTFTEPLCESTWMLPFGLSTETLPFASTLTLPSGLCSETTGLAVVAVPVAEGALVLGVCLFVAVVFPFVWNAALLGSAWVTKCRGI